MSFNTQYDHPLVLTDDDTFIFGVCMLGDTFGQVKNVKVGRKGDEKEFMNCDGSLRAFMLRNTRFELQFNCLLPTGKDAPELLSEIVFPYAQVTGHVVDWEVTYDEDNERILSMNCKSWDSFADGEGGTTAVLYEWDGNELNAVVPP